MPTLLRVQLTGDNDRNAREALRTRLEGVITLEEPVQIEVGADYLEASLSDDLPAEELQALVRTIANLVDRPGSGIDAGITLNPENTDTIPRSYSV